MMPLQSTPRPATSKRLVQLSTMIQMALTPIPKFLDLWIKWTVHQRIYLRLIPIPVLLQDLLLLLQK
jgi:hypothetical protein